MDLPTPPAPNSAISRAPLSGLKFMLAVLVIFVLLAGYGQWERARRERTVTATIESVPNESATPSPSPDPR